MTVQTKFSSEALLKHHFSLKIELLFFNGTPSLLKFVYNGDVFPRTQSLVQSHGFQFMSACDSKEPTVFVRTELAQELFTVYILQVPPAPKEKILRFRLGWIARP